MESIYKILEHFSSVIYFVGTLSKMVFLAGIKYEHEQPRLWQKTLHCVHECVHVCVCVCLCVRLLKFLLEGELLGTLFK